MTDNTTPQTPNDDTQPLTPVDAAPDVVIHLTDEQREILEKAVGVQPVGVYCEVAADGVYIPLSGLGGNITSCRLLVDLGMLKEHPQADFFYRITDAGRAAIAPQPGDTLPPSESTDDVGAEPNAHPDGPAGDYEQATIEKLIHQLAAKETALQGSRDRIEHQDAQLRELRTANERKSEQLADMRIERDIARKQLEQRGPDSLAQLEARIAELEAIFRETAEYELVDAGELRARKVEFTTLVQVIVGSGTGDGERALAEHVNAGWEIADISSKTFPDSTGDYTVIIHRREILLQREIVDDLDDGSGPDDRVEVEPPAEPEPVAVRDSVLDLPPIDADLIQTYQNAADVARADGLVIAVTPLPPLFVNL